MSWMPIDPLLARPPGDWADCEGSSDPSDANDLGVVDAARRISGAAADEEVVVREDVESAYRRLYPQLFRLALLLVDTAEFAEEAVQDAFAKAYPKWNRIEHPDSYVRVAVVHTCRSVQRRRGLLRRTPPPRADDAVLGADHVADVVRRLPLKLPIIGTVTMPVFVRPPDSSVGATSNTVVEPGA